MTEKKTIPVQYKDGSVKECFIEITQEAPWKLTLSGLGINREYSGQDLFEAFIKLRLELEGLGAQILCAGARLDVFPSGMSRSMGGGRKVYINRLGTPALHADLVDIFDSTDFSLVGGVAQQEEFHRKWVESLGAKR